jgi:transposase
MLPPSVKIYLSREPTDMRKGHDGLAALVQGVLCEDLYSGHLFVFVSKRRDRVKVLSWDRGGLVLWYKPLEKGKFKMPKLNSTTVSVALDYGQLSLLLEGLDYSKVKRPKRWEPPQKSA